MSLPWLLLFIPYRKKLKLLSLAFKDLALVFLCSLSLGGSHMKPHPSHPQDLQFLTCTWGFYSTVPLLVSIGRTGVTDTQ